MTLVPMGSICSDMLRLFGWVANSESLTKQLLCNSESLNRQLLCNEDSLRYRVTRLHSQAASW